MSYRIPFLAVLFLLLSPLSVFAETTGTLNISVQSTPITTGLFAYTVSTCASNQDCFGYQCLLDFDTGGTWNTNYGICAPTSNTTCIHDDGGGNFNVVNSSYYICGNLNTTYRQCNNGNWSGQLNCSSGQICSVNVISSAAPCTTSSSATTTTSGSGGGGGGGGGSASYSIDLTASANSFDVVQGNSFSVVLTAKNAGNTTITNVSLSVSGIDSGWMVYSPSQMVLSAGNSNSFKVNITVPADADVKSYTALFTVKSKENATDSYPVDIRVLPSITTNTEIEKLYQNYLVLLQQTQAKITDLENRNADKNDIRDLKNYLTNAQSKLNQANLSLAAKDYFTAKQYLDDAKNLIDGAERQIPQVKFTTASPVDSIYVQIIIVVLLVIAGVLVYLFWPSGQKRVLSLPKIFRGKK